MNRLSDATLNGMTKKQLIEYVRMCEHNYDIAEETLRQQAENCKDWRPVKHGKWVDIGRLQGLKCSNCGKRASYNNGNPCLDVYWAFCPACGSDNRGDSDGDQV